jgi:hypothetical protein
VAARGERVGEDAGRLVLQVLEDDDAGHGRSLGGPSTASRATGSNGAGGGG